MKNIVPKDSRYIPFTQQDYCCAPTCIQMIMYRHGIPLLPAELIGYHLGLIVPKKESFKFYNARIGKKPIAGWGTQVYRDGEYSPNEAFKKLNIPLKMELRLIDQFDNLKSFKEYLKEIKSNDKDVMVCFDAGTIFNSGYHGGHLCLVDTINLSKGEVRVIDPWYVAPKWRTVKIEKLFKAMRVHGAKKTGGFWEFIYVGK